jgi:RNA polymerase sigma-70 factor (ECF subfamily)
MDERAWLVGEFEGKRSHLRGVAYRMLGSLTEADDAVQEAWIRLNRSDTSEVENLGGWLTTVVARVCLDMLRSRGSRREDPLETQVGEPAAAGEQAIDPEEEAVLADSVGLALLVVLETLTPAERLAFVLHDMFAVPYDEIAPVVGRAPAAARQLASRARRRVQGAAAVPDADLSRQREVVDAFLSASRAGDFDALLAVLDPDVVLRTDPIAAPPGFPQVARGSTVVVNRALAAAHHARSSQLALVDGVVGLVIAPHGRLRRVLAFTISGRRIAEIDVIADPERLRLLHVAVLDG